MDGEEDDHPSYDKTEIYPIVREDDVKSMMEQLNFTEGKWPSMPNGLLNCESALCSYQMNKKRTQIKSELFLPKM